jgi:hypothetical protein
MLQNDFFCYCSYTSRTDRKIYQQQKSGVRMPFCGPLFQFTPIPSKLLHSMSKKSIADFDPLRGGLFASSADEDAAAPVATPVQTSSSVCASQLSLTHFTPQFNIFMRPPQVFCKLCILCTFPVSGSGTFGCQSHLEKGHDGHQESVWR